MERFDLEVVWCSLKPCAPSRCSASRHLPLKSQGNDRMRQSRTGSVNGR